MFKKILIILVGLFIGLILGYNAYFFAHKGDGVGERKIIGFLPYWLITKAQRNYAPYITTLTYFGITVDGNGHINKSDDEPGYKTLVSGRANKALRTVKKNGVQLSLLIASGDQEQINELIADPVSHATNLLKDVMPLMKRYGFTDLNLDIESTVQSASDAAQMNFTEFVRNIRQGMRNHHGGTLTVEILASDLIKKDLIRPSTIAPFVDYLVLMAYDYHYQGSSVTGPVSPLFGAGTVLEYDTQTAVQKALVNIQAAKIILGIPLYGYEWETLSNVPRAAVIPGTGVAASNARVEKLLASCSTCSAELDAQSQESYLIFQDGQTGTFHQFFYPDKESTAAKVSLVKQTNLGGIALWALGYDGNDILSPLVAYKKM